MNLQGNEIEPSSSWAAADAFSEVVSAIQRAQAPSISVPQLSKFLGVKTTTLNARFRREQTTLKTVGRTNFISRDLALHLAELHKYALIGWPTLQQASRLTGVKPGTIKARCEKGRLEGHVDLTKRLRINPVELENLRRQSACELNKNAGVGTPDPFAGNRGRTKSRVAFSRQARLRVESLPGRKRSARFDASGNGPAKEIPVERPPFIAPAPPEPEIKILTGKDYGLPDVEHDEGAQSPAARRNKEKVPGHLTYDPDRPFPISICTVGQSISYGQNDGTIIGIINDPFCPKIHVKFPHHQHPLMREVLLRVEKRKTSAAG